MKREQVYKIDHGLTVSAKNLIDQIHDYGVDVKSNHIYLMGEESYIIGASELNGDEPGVEYSMANRFIKNMNLCMRINKHKPIVIHMKSCGGDENEGMAIYDTIMACPNPVTILVYTHARSMTSIILQAANKKVMMPHGYFMFHEGTLAFEGTSKGVKSNVKFQNERDKYMLEIYAKSMRERGEMSKLSIEQIKKWLQREMNKKEDVFLTVRKAIALGLVDEEFNADWSSLTKYTDQQLMRG